MNTFGKIVVGALLLGATAGSTYAGLKINKLSKDNKTLNDTVTKITEENNALKGNKEELLNLLEINNNQLTELNSGLKTAEKLKAEKETLLTNVNSQLETDAENATLLKNKAKLESDLSQLTLTIDSLNATINNIKDEIFYIRLMINRPGLYKSGTETMTKSWQKLIDDGDIDISNGRLVVVNKKLSGDLICGQVEGLTDLSYAFDNCDKLTSIDLFALNTKSVTNVEYMFNMCWNLEQINFTNFDTSNVTNMNNMFSFCESLVDLDISNFNTSKVTDMSYMFSGCSKLTNLDISNFNTGKVTNMSYMFYFCRNLINLYIHNFNTSNVTNMSGLFSTCDNLADLDLYNFDTSKVTDMSYMFSGCSKLNTLNVSNLNTSNVTDMRSMFDYLNVTDLDLSSFDTSKVTNMSSMFNCCRNLMNLNISSFDTSNVTNMNQMFVSCENLVDLDISNFNTSKVTDMYGMFVGCSKLSKINLGQFNIVRFNPTDSSVYFADIQNLFLDCNDLTEITFFGTTEDWKAFGINTEQTGIKEDGTVTVHCSDGDYVICASE